MTKAKKYLLERGKTWLQLIFLLLAPFGLVPALEIDSKFVLPETMAILRYVGDQHGLQAKDPLDRALADAIATTWTDASPLFDACDWATMKWDVSKVFLFWNFFAISFKCTVTLDATLQKYCSKQASNTK